MEVLLEDISKLELEHLTDDWVDYAIAEEFTSFLEIPEAYKSILDAIEIKTVFQTIIITFSSSSDDDETEEFTWSDLSDVIPIKNLIALIGYLIKEGANGVAVSNVRDIALVAARAYFKMLMIPGGRAYNVYHSQLFAHTISCLAYPKMMCDKNNQFGGIKNLSNEVNHVLSVLLDYVHDLRDIILQLKLTPDDINFEDILSNLLDVTGGSITQTLANVDRIVMSKVLGMIYNVINSMLCNYGDQPNAKAINLLFKCMLPKLIATCSDNKAASNIVRASYVTYTGLIVTSFGRLSIVPYTTMLEHLCYNTDYLERVEPRHARSEMVVDLMSLLSDQRHRTFVQWLIVLSTTARAVHRHIALEVLARLLNNEPEINMQRATLSSEIEKQRAVAATMRNVSSDHSYVRPPMDQAVDNEVAEEDEEVSGILRQQAHTVPIDQILEVVYECAQDVSSQVRNRALAVLCESAASDRAHMRLALQRLNGDGEAPRLMALATRGVCDERAVVRRSGVALILRVLRATERELQPADLVILQKLCRDAAVTVRNAAINAIAELLENRPSDVTVDAFLMGPMPQLTDPESKVSDHVKTHVENLVLKRLVKYSPDGYTDQLPWMILQGVIRMKMKRQLDLACAQLARSDTCISFRLVDILSSHVGVSPERDLQCLVLLSCVARHVDYSDLGFVLDLYYKTSRDPDPMADPPFRVDSRMLQQILDLLNAWAQFLKPPDRAALRDNLITRLATAPDDGCRSATVMLAYALDREDLVWATELMRLCERRALENQNLQEAVRAVDLGLVTPEPPSQELLLFILNSIENPPPDCTEAMMGLLVVSLGRVSLRSRPAATMAAPGMARVLHSRAAPLPARVNALVALADVSRRYTSLVEPLLVQMCACLLTSEPAKLRRAASRSITELLLAGFLRLRDTLYYKYVALLADSDPLVRGPAEYFVTSHLTAETICHNFVDCILRYNKANEEEDIILDYNGRQLVYDVLLQRLTMIQKLNTQCRLAREVLQHAADLADEGEIPEDLHDALLDTIRVLVGPRMQLPKKPQPMGETADIDDLQHRVTANIVSHKMKRTVAEVLVPAVMRLYSRLGSGGGQLATYLVMLAGELEREYKNEIEELLDNDEELVERIAHFREHFSVERSAGNARNLVTDSGPPEPDTPRSTRRAAPRPAPRPAVSKRTLKI